MGVFKFLPFGSKFYMEMFNFQLLCSLADGANSIRLDDARVSRPLHGR